MCPSNRPLVILLATAMLLVPFTVGGCASAGRDFDDTQVSSIQKGVTTEQDLITMFGQPENRSMNSDGQTVLTWMYTHGHVNGKSFIPFAGAFMGGTNSASKSLTVTLKDDKVVTYAINNGQMETHHT
jgi:hypothetical protein